MVVTDASKGIKVAADNYLKNVKTEVSEDKLVVKTIDVKDISVANINGNSYYYILDNDGKKYKASITLSDNLPYVKVGDKIKIAYLNELDIIEVEKVY